ncbi:gamma-glutamyltransferase [Pelagibius sp. CAU 1746]|uniref:gamma-glutamyltransferase family protein n=1 Tax=Pelagibius sp. CAU 1746 TaxID=3140370 RepID=UPI00325A64CD
MLELGGNAFDAAVAGGFLLQVVAPHLNGPAGDVAMLFHDARSGESAAICGQGPAPESATLELFAGLGLDIIPGTGLLPAVVPGAFDAWMLLLEEKGTLPLRTVLEPCLDYLSRGIVVDARLHATLDAAAGIFERYWPSSVATFLPGGKVPQADETLSNPVLFEFFQRLLREAESAGSDRLRQIEAARATWSDGFVAETIDRFCRQTEVMDVSGRVHGAALRGSDMAGWRATVEPALSLRYGDFEVLKCDSWTQGPALLQSMTLLPFDEMAELDPLGDLFVHRLVEAIKLAFADREVFYGDPLNARVPMARLLSPEYAAERRSQIGDDADNSWRPGAIAGCGRPIDYGAACLRKRDAGLLSAYGGGEPTVQSIEKLGYQGSISGDTCHIDVVDAQGNMVSATPSGGWLQSSPAIPELGFPLGTRAQMMWLDPDAPSGLVPGQRPRSTLTPTLVLDGQKRSYLACGTPGGDQQDQWQLQFLIRHLVHGMGLQEAIEAPAFHSEHFPNSFYPRHASPGRLVVEGRFADEVQEGLRRRGHDLSVAEDWSEGRLCAVARDPDGRLRGAANPRGGLGYAVGR